MLNLIKYHKRIIIKIGAWLFFPSATILTGSGVVVAAVNVFKKSQEPLNDYVYCTLSAYVYYDVDQPQLPAGWKSLVRFGDPSQNTYFGKELGIRNFKL